MQESKEHLYQKQRIRDLARARGHIAIDELILPSWSPYHNRVINYYADVFILSKDGRPIIVEIFGFKGHSSKYQTIRDERRIQDIQHTYEMNIESFSYTLSELKLVTDEEILDDMDI